VPSQLSLDHDSKQWFSLQPSDRGLTLNGTVSPALFCPGGVFLTALPFLYNRSQPLAGQLLRRARSKRDCPQVACRALAPRLHR
jgi:hypothetical protein